MSCPHIKPRCHACGLHSAKGCAIDLVERQDRLALKPTGFQPFTTKELSPEVMNEIEAIEKEIL